MQRVTPIFLLLFCLVVKLNAQTNFTSELNLGINFYSASREEIVFDKSIEESTKGQYEFTTKTYNFNSLIKDSFEIINFIGAVNTQILEEKIKAYEMNYKGDPSILKEVEPEYYFYRHDTEFVENEKGHLFPIPISDTVDYSKVKRIDCTQEWFYNLKKNKLDVKIISFSPFLQVYDEAKEFKGWRRYYTRKQGDFSSIENRKKIVKNSNTIWAQRIQCSIPITDFKLENPKYSTTQPIKSVMNPELSNILFNQILNGKIKAFIPNTNTEYTTPRLDSLMTSRKDTEFIETEYGDLEVIEIIEPYTINELGQLRIKQQLTFNHKTLKIEAIVEKVILTLIIDDHNDRFKEYKELFEIRFE